MRLGYITGGLLLTGSRHKYRRMFESVADVEITDTGCDAYLVLGDGQATYRTAIAQGKRGTPVRYLFPSLVDHRCEVSLVSGTQTAGRRAAFFIDDPNERTD